MITKDIKIFMEFRDKLITELVEIFDSSIHPELSNGFDYNVIADNIIKLIDTYEQKINRSEIDINE